MAGANIVKGLLRSYGGRAGFSFDRGGFSNPAGGSIRAGAGNIPVPGFLQIFPISVPLGILRPVVHPILRRLSSFPYK